MDASLLHVPVMRGECLDLLRPALAGKDGAVFVDCTLGMAGHATAVLEGFSNVHLVGIDRDAAALELAGGRLDTAGFSGRYTLVHDTYDHVAEALDESGFDEADAILMDLGLSSFQIDTRERGFAYSVDAPLDMRMNPASDSETAADLLNTLPEGELRRILSTYGEEKFAKGIARGIVRARDGQPFVRSHQLVEVIEHSIPAKARFAGSHPAKRTFQALRIAVNDELEILDSALEAAMGVLANGGRLVIESYHSLEDRMVKNAFARASSSSAPVDLPVELDHFLPNFRLVTRGALKAPQQEVERNSRAASVRLRGLERIRTSEMSR